ncbi:MAG TPA: hypothetical protein PLX89_14865 [Verrucomicrobiota bacterium]|nr:hypothetical protein [Verrucomicrobiales bacterium]HRI14273.1 hypothetical protein [Verrucomicrobiota bacterium]
MSAYLLTPRFRLRLLPIIASLTLVVAVAAGVERTQSIQLRTGWNAVYLEVQPANATSDDIFAQLPVDTVASFFPGRLEGQFLRQPGDAPWREEGWGVWYSPQLPESALSTLREIPAPRALLIRATADFTWNVSGEARASVLKWYADTCTFTGLPVDPESPPTFAQFFSSSSGHRRLRIFRLEQDTWKLVRQPTLARARSGEAYWIQTDGASHYQGPLGLSLPASGELAFDRIGRGRPLRIVNEASSTEAHVQIAIVGGPNPVPLWQLSRDATTLATVRQPVSETVHFPPLSAGDSTTWQVEPHRSAMTADSSSALLRISDGRGTLHWVPLNVLRQPDSAMSLSRP